MPDNTKRYAIVQVLAFQDGAIKKSILGTIFECAEEAELEASKKNVSVGAVLKAELTGPGIPPGKTGEDALSIIGLEQVGYQVVELDVKGASRIISATQPVPDLNLS